MQAVLSWGKSPKLVFANEEEYYRTLGQLSNENAFTISFEPNKRTGSYSDAYRIRVLTGGQNISQALRNKMTTANRINCNDYVLNLLENHGFVQSGNTIKRGLEDVMKTVPDPYKRIFMLGYNEVTDAPFGQVFYSTDSIDVSGAVLIEKSIPSPGSRKKTVRKKQGKRDYIQKAINDYEIGEAGERIVYEYEKKKLKDACTAGKIPDWTDKLEWISRNDDSAGYDIRSYDVEKEEEIFIEVKTTTAQAAAPFYMSENELKRSAELADQYLLYRLYGMDRHKPTNVNFYILQGDIRKNPMVNVEEKGEYQVRLFQEDA